jgi:GntR family transcriptional repressor for pyruvate dehydrogenase complex
LKWKLLILKAGNNMTVNFGTLQKEALSEKIAERLLSLIKEKQLKPGDRLPPERELAVSMGVSRPSLREALRALSIMHIIENRQGSGTYITSLQPETLVEHLDFIIALNDRSFLDLFEARKILEVGLASTAALTIRDEELDGLKECLDRAAKEVDDPEAFLQSDLELHQRILESARNQILALFMKSINDLNIASRRRTGESRKVREQTLKDHRLILSALRTHDAQLSGQAMRDHLNHVEQHLKAMSLESAREEK